LIGRPVTTEDEQPGRDHVAVLGYDLWRQDFGGDAGLVGKTVSLNDEDYAVIGIMPPGFQFPSGQEMPDGQQFEAATEVWVPLTTPGPAVQNDRVTNSFRAVARLKAGVSLEQAQSQMTAITRRMVAEHLNELQGLEVLVSTMKENQVGGIRPALLVLLAAVAFVLLIACANIANLLLSRSAARQREFVVRAALGAARGRIIRQLLTDSVVLSAMGGILGLALAFAANRLLAVIGPAAIPRLGGVDIDLRVLAFTILISTGTGIVFGLAPALQASRPDLHEGMKEGGRSVAGSRQQWVRNLLIVSEVTLVFVLLVGAGLMLKSFRRLMDVAPGIDVQNVLTARIALPSKTYPGIKRIPFYRQLLEGLSREPGVRSAAIIRDLPFSGTDPRYGFTIEGRPVDANGGVTFRYRVISPDYFKVMGIPLRAGRYMNDHDDQTAPCAVVINETTARRNWSGPGEDPLGQVILPVGAIAPPRCVVVGVVGDVKFRGLDSGPDVEVFFSYAQIPEPVLAAVIGSMAVTVRTEGSPERFAAAVRRQVWLLDKNIPVSSLVTMNQLLNDSVASRRFQMLLLGAFAGIALALAVVGIYGVVSHWAVQRTQEIGIRMTLGATSRDVLWLILGRGMALTGAGMLLGLGAALALTRLMGGLLYGVASTDTVTFVAVAILLISTAAAASSIPAWRAARTDPVAALREG
jgi:predicted permease